MHSVRRREGPSGTVTLLSCGLDERAPLQEQLGDCFAEVLARHTALLAQAVERNGGHRVEVTDEGSLFAFSEPRGALEAAVAAQRALHAEPWPQGVTVHARMGLHTGVPRRAEDRYVGLDVHRAACIAGAAQGGHLLLSAATRALLREEDLEGLTVRELGAHHLADLRYPEHLFGIGIPDVPTSSAPLHTFSAVRHNLPSQPTAFIGREAQIAQATALLRRADTRLVTLTGAGGSGKTRLSLEIARALLADFPAGVLQVPLAPVTDPALVPATIAQVLDVPLVPGKPVTESLKARIGNECRESVALFEGMGDEIAAARAKIALGATSSVEGPLEESIRALERGPGSCERATRSRTSPACAASWTPPTPAPRWSPRSKPWRPRAWCCAGERTSWACRSS